MSMSKIHNVKFYKLDPRGINCMALENNRKKIALSRSDATIEIWDLSNTPYVERVIPNKSNASIEALCWFNKRLFSVGLDGHLTEYDIITLSAKYSVPITGGVGWCMDVHRKTSKLVIGTEQGYLNLYEITNEGVEYVKVFDKQEGRILCLKFERSGEFISSGSSDTVRIWNVKSGHAVHKMNLSRSTANVETVVWCLQILDNFTVVSGDSRGFITFWDGFTGSQIESCKSHCAAVLSICSSYDNKTIYCAGIDPLIMSYEKISIKGKSDKWVRSVQRKIHDHDVRCLVYLDNKLYSAGVDGYLACSYYPPRTLVKYPPLLENPYVSIARTKRLILLRYHKSIEIWSLGQEDDEGKIGILKLKEEPIKLLEVQTKHGEGTICAAISNNGKMIMYSTGSRMRLFQFRCKDNNPELTPVDSLPQECISCVRAEFKSDNKEIILAPKSGGLQILNVSDNQVFISQNIDTSNYIKDTITFLKISTCGNYLVVADPESNVAVWNCLNGNWKYYVSLPKYTCPPTAINIHPTTADVVIIYSDHRIVEYSLTKRKFTDFSTVLNVQPPRQWLSRSFPVMNVTFDPQESEILMLHDDASICIVDKRKKLPSGKTKIPKLDSSSSLEGTEMSKLADHAFYIIKRTKHLAYFNWLDKGEMVSVEINPLSLLEKLPPGLKKEKFGTK